MVSREQITTVAAGGVAVYAVGRLTGLIGGGGGDTADPVSQGGPSRGDRNTTGSDDAPMITPRVPGLEAFIERQRARSPASFETTEPTETTTQETTQATETGETTTTAGGGGTADTDTATTGTADTAAGDDRQAVGEPGDLESDGEQLGDLFAGGLSGGGDDRNVTGEPGSTSASDDQNAGGGPTADARTGGADVSTDTSDNDTSTMSALVGRGSVSTRDDDDDDDRSSSTSASDDDSGSDLADSFSGGLSSSRRTDDERNI